jgi:hypothetical protein
MRLGVAPALRFALLLALPGSAAAQDSLTITPLQNGAEWLRPDAALELGLSRPIGSSEGRLAVFLGHSDLSALFVASANRLVYRRAAVPLPAGKAELVVYLVSPAGEWRELSRSPLQVLTGGGYQEVQLTPRLSLSNKGQLAEGHGTAPPPERDRYQDFTLNTGFQTLHAGKGWSLKSQSNFVGVSNRLEALRYGERQDRAPKFDLSDYLITLERGTAGLSLGHVSYGSNRHLVNGFSSRGLTGTARLGPAELSLAAMNGTSVVGWSNPLGLARSAHRILSGTLGLEVAPQRPGLVRVEASVLDGSLLPQAGYTQGVVNDAETNRGLGFRVSAADPSQRIRLEAGFSRSRFDNPRDSTLEQGATLVPVRATSRNARYLDASVDVLRGVKLSAALPLTLAASFRHQRIDPLFRSVAASSQADLQENALGLTGTLGQLALQATLGRSHDNLGALPTILTTRTRAGSLNLALPLGFVAGSLSTWYPTLTYGLTRMHQFGTGIPVNSDFSASHVPDQFSTNHSLGAQWQARLWHAGYQLGRSSQDNRQTGRETADFGNLTQAIAFGVTPLASLDLGLDLGFERADNKEVSQHSRTRRIGGTADWRFTANSALAASLAITRSTDDPRTMEQRNSELRLELSQRVSLFRLSASQIAGQFFVRFARQTGEIITSAGASQPLKTWNLNSGVSLTVF